MRVRVRSGVGFGSVGKIRWKGEGEVTIRVRVNRPKRR